MDGTERRLWRLEKQVKSLADEVRKLRKRRFKRGPFVKYFEESGCKVRE